LRPSQSLIPTLPRRLPILTLLTLVISGITLLPPLARALPTTPVRPAQPISYSLTTEDAKSGLFQVQITLPVAGSHPIDFAIPAWTPGYYQILHYEAKIENVSAHDGTGSVLTVAHPSPRIWEVTPHSPNTPLFLMYSVHADDQGQGFFGSTLTQTTGYVNGASAFMLVTGQSSLPINLSVNLPLGWHIASPLSESGGRVQPDSNLHRFRAENYDELIDCPLQFGLFDAAEFRQDGVDFHCIFVGKHEADKRQITAKLAQTVHAAIRVFGNAPFHHYYFIYHIDNGSEFYGGLEHRNSTVIHLGAPLHAGDDDDFLVTSAHEFFHAWNVKRIRPEGLGPFDLSQPVRTPSLWFAEGVTDYYASLLPYRAGLRSRDWFLKDLEGRIAELDSTSARVRVSLALASNNAWEGMSAGFDGLNYYLKGSLVGFYFDLRIRELTQGAKSLDDVMRLLDARFGSHDRAYTDSDLLAAINAVSQSDLAAEYRSYIHATDEIAWEEPLRKGGLLLHREAQSALGIHLDGNAKPDASPLSHDAQLPLAIVDTVEQGLSGAAMGLQAGDRILKLNSEAVTLTSLVPMLHKLPPHSPITLLVQRGDRQITLTGKTDMQFSNHRLTSLPEAQQTPDSLRILEGLGKL